MRFLAALSLLSLAACSSEFEPAPLVALENTHFTVRGRLSAPTVHYQFDATGSPLETDRVEAACRAAAALWNATGVATFAPASSDHLTLRITFERDVHGPCTPFGRSPTLAHTGPVGAENYIHLDAERDWATDPKILERILAHEFGHVLGLGHSLDPVALMYTEDDPRRDELRESDLAGLRSLYGGGAAGSDDLVLRKGNCQSTAAALCSLRGVAPRGRTEVRAFDTQGDGLTELLLWETGLDQQGDLTIYSFDERLSLSKTLGPLRGICPPGTAIHLGTTTTGERLLVRVGPAGRVHALGFDALGNLVARMERQFALAEVADVDGDGLMDRADRAPSPANSNTCLLTCDMNSDGVLESVHRIAPIR